MAVTGGSDFHGEHIPSRKLGLTSGGREIPDRFLEPFRPGLPRAGGADRNPSLNPSEA